MHFVEKRFGKHIYNFVLQEFIEGCVISSEFFCSESGFISPPNHTVEVKKAMNDDLGPSTGCSGNIAWVCGDDNIIINGVGRVQDICIENKFVGQIDLNTVVNETGVYGLEWTPRFGYDSIPVMLSLLNTDFGKFFADIASDQVNEADFSDNFASGVRVTIPPYPVEPKEGIDVEDFSPNKGVPIQNYEGYCENLYLYEVCLDRESLVHAGGTGVIACAVDTDKDASESLLYPYEILDNLVIPDKQYRTDLKDVLPKMVEESMEYA
jgi:phosphoribosylamine--glycine ligase